jgi:hypothetical protein
MENIKTLKETLFHDFGLIKEMTCSEPIKIKLLSTLFSANPNCWRVVGITPNALSIFASNNFERKSRMGINRSHVYQRNTIYRNMLSMDFSGKEEFWDYYFKHDYTILATSTENMNGGNLEDLAIEVSQDQRMLFRTRGYAWKHGDHEIAFLKELYSKHIEGRD